MSSEWVQFDLGTNIRHTEDPLRKFGGLKKITPLSIMGAEYGEAGSFDDTALAIFGVAGAIAVIALVAGGVYVTYQVAETTKVAGNILQTGAEAGKIATEGASELGKGLGNFFSDIFP